MKRPKLRKPRSASKKKAQKAAQKELSARVSSMLDHSMECEVCAAPFERSKETVKSWMVTVVEKKVRLACPSCWKRINERIERLEDED